MSVSMWLDKTATHQRQTPVKDAVGGNAPTWATQTANVPVAVWSKNSVIAKDFMRRDIVGTNVVVTSSDIDARATDRLLIAGVYYTVNGADLYHNAALGSEIVYAIDATVRTV